MMAVAGLELLGDILAVLTPGVPQRLMFVLNLVAGLSIAGLSAALVFGRWPQVVRPTALCFLSKVVANGLSMVATLLSSTVVASALVGVLPEAGQDVAASTAVVASVGGAAFLALSMFISASLLVFYFYLGRRAWRIDQEYRSLAGAVLRSDTTSHRRQALGRIAWAAGILYVVVNVGGSVYNLFSSASAAPQHAELICRRKVVNRILDQWRPWGMEHSRVEADHGFRHQPAPPGASRAVSREGSGGRAQEFQLPHDARGRPIPDGRFRRRDRVAHSQPGQPRTERPQWLLSGNGARTARQ